MSEIPFLRRTTAETVDLASLLCLLAAGSDGMFASKSSNVSFFFSLGYSERISVRISSNDFFFFAF
jgi:hypothetical protein